MGRFWFISAPLFGHLDWGGFLQTAQTLHNQGHQVTWISERQIGGYLVQQGIPFEPITSTGWLWPPPAAPNYTQLSDEEARAIRYQRALDTWLNESLIPKAVETLLALAERKGPPDLIVTDPFLSAAALAAERLDVKLAVCGWPAAADPDEKQLLSIQVELGQLSRERIERLCQRFAVQGVNFAKGLTPSVQSPHQHISFFSQHWYHDISHVLPQTIFVGGTRRPATSPLPQWLLDIPNEQPSILITLGSVFTGDMVFFVEAAHAAHHLGKIPIVVIGYAAFAPEDKARLKASLPPGTRLLNWVDFAHVMPRSSAIIHHGGMGTTHAAILHALPQIIVPHAADQRGQARRAAQTGVGLHLTPHQVANGAFISALNTALENEEMHRQCQFLAMQFAQLGGPGYAADQLVAMVP